MPFSHRFAYLPEVEGALEVRNKSHGALTLPCKKVILVQPECGIRNVGTKMAELEGVRALVTGGARGIGAATCIALAQRGADVAIADLRADDDAAAVAAKAASFGRQVTVVTGDIGRVAECRKLVEDAAETLGGLSLVVNSAGGGFGYSTPFADVTEDQYDLVVNVNLKGTYFVTQAAVPHLLRADEPSVVNIASDAAHLGIAGNVAYGAAKGGILGFTRSLARALAPRVRVNAVAPGPTATDRFVREGWATETEQARMLLARFATPEDVAMSVAFLAGPGGRHYTGQTLDPNGGSALY